MPFVEIFFIALGLAMDAFAVSLGASASNYVRGARPAIRLSFHFALFQFMMPVIGWFLGIGIQHIVESFDHWIAFTLLLYIGVKMIRASLDTSGNNQKRDPSRGSTLIMLSVATSIDALAVGFSLALLNVNIWYPSFIIGVVTGVLCLLAIKMGSRLGVKYGRMMEFVGGIILIIIGIKILIEHLTV